MKAVQVLPHGYVSMGRVDLSRDYKTLLWMNLLGIGLLVASGWLGVRAAYWLQPLAAQQALSGLTLGSSNIWLALAVPVVLMLILIVLHEAIHGMCFALYTRSRPVFGWRGAYAFACAPGWYLPRPQYLVTALAPVVVLTLLSLVLLAVVPQEWILAVIIFLVLDVSGAAGDLVVAAWLAAQPRTCYALDEGDAVTLYLPG